MNHVDSCNEQSGRLQQARRDGFTLIELMLAMTFISILLLAIAMTIIQIGTIYNKGIVVKEINQAARAIGDDLRRTTAASEAFNIATDFVSTSGGGRLCLGTYSYVWNTVKALENNDVNITTFAKANQQPIHLVKVPDSAKLYCSRSPSTPGTLVYKQIREADTSTARELIPAGDHALGVTNLSLVPAAAVSDASTGESIYTLNYTLGAGSIEAMNADQSACLGPGNIKADLTYCTVQPFTLVLRTGNKVN